MRRAEIEAAGDLGGEALAALATGIQDMHEAIAGRPFAALGAAAAPVRAVHDGVSRAAYGGVREALRAASLGLAGVVAAGADPGAPSLASRPRGSLALGALNGIYGNHLAARGSDLALDMGIRRGGADLEPCPEALAAAYPAATARIAVFVHGLGETDEAWRLLSRRRAHGKRRTYGERLLEDLGYTPVYLRYNTGLHVSDNGRSLASLLEEVVEAWPSGVEQIALVGHSMGGLVARSACHYAQVEGRAWARAVRHVFCLGTPHLGADLEKGVHVLGWALGRLPETRAFASVLEARGDGVKDLRFGACVEEDWSGCDPGEFLRDRCQEVPFLPDANYYFVGATLSEGPLGTALGDLLVRTPSASGRGNGRGRSIPFEVDKGRELTGLTHFDLLNHPDVYEQIRGWLASGPCQS